MKKLPTIGASVVLALVLFFAQVNMSSCTKDTVTTDTVRTIINDTTTIKDTVAPTPLTSAQILVKYSPWEVDELDQDISGVWSYYKRGGLSNTIDQDATRLTFNASGTGTYTDLNGTLYTSTWQFTNPADTDINVVFVNGAFTSSNQWSLISITDTSFIQTTVLPSGILTSRYVPVP